MILALFLAAATPAPAPARAAAAAPAAASAPASQASSEPVIPQEQLELMLDRAIETLLSKRYGEAATKLYFVYHAMEESELKRDIAQYYLAEALRELDFTQAAAEHYIDVVTSRRAPDMASRSLKALDGLARRGLVEENRLIDDVLFGAQFGELDETTQGFVDYYQGLGELRRNYTNWGESRLETLFSTEGFYAHRARFALGVLRLQQDNKEGAEKIFTALIEAKEAPSEVKNDARAGMGRIRYEQKRFDEAFSFYAQVDSPPSAQAAILLEKAWTEIAAEDEPRALGMAIGLGAPIYRRSFAPERDLIRALSLNRLCQFRAAHATVLAFRDKYRELLVGIREAKPLDGMELLVDVSRAGEDAREIERIFRRTEREGADVDKLVDRGLVAHAKAMYGTRKALLERKRVRKLETGLARTADTLLAVDEQMNILDYEIGIGLFKRFTVRGNRGESMTLPPADAPQAYFKFVEEYWSDELRDYSVLARDRCIR